MRPCGRCAHAEELHRDTCEGLFGGMSCPCPVYEADRQCTAADPMPTPGPHDWETWTHQNWGLVGVDAQRRKHEKCLDCGTTRVRDEDGEVALAPNGPVSPPPVKISSLPVGSYSAAQLAHDFVERSLKTDVRAACNILVSEDAEGPVIKVYFTDCDVATRAMMAQALNLKVQLATLAMMPDGNDEE